MSKSPLKIKPIRDLLGPGTPGHDEWMRKPSNSDYAVGYCPESLWPLLLTGKMHEEIEEIANARDDVNEHADVQQLLYDHAILYGITPSDIEFARLTKLERRGGFTLRKVLYRD